MLSQVVKCDDSDADELAAGSSRLDPARILNVALLDHGHCGRWPFLKHQSYYNRSFLCLINILQLKEWPMTLVV